MKDLNSNIHVIQGIVPAVYAAAQAASNVVDRAIGDAAGGPGAAGPSESLELVITFGAVTGSATGLIEESDDNVTFGAVAAADLLGGALPAITVAQQNTVIKRGYIGTKRYVRFRTSAGAASYTMGAAWVLSHIAHAPAPATL